MKWILVWWPGRTGYCGKDLSSISKLHKYFCITHLPQVASMADSHLFIRKQVANDRTITSVTVLTMEDKVTEIARNDF